MKTLNAKLEKRTRRHTKIRAKVSGTKEKPRLSVHKSNKHISAQLIDDENSKTIASVHSREVKAKSMTEKAVLVGEAIAKKAIDKKIKEVVFDRGGFIYTGNIKALADGARKGGLKF
ncbi:MAG: 50S ribosomal protein L18 [Candidatus Zambryskibacteria bacterium RIFOXYD1_FULL_40_13]|nr:MAG: 50S ribosomal protein L18 [Candidatus Zambryskibacteria bacterium GWB1_40_5]OHB15062.1 MAG: 50S ribosomal protein L18 [Candidatus Zambryskibacteria bacterium RIFOXYD1_FULL_40_13]HBD24618.1 50S ribosomal protein L18 [Candidatus Zambryskibacteria bacterium]HBO17417.1 50S ribosomal protein L18 [Candidatus Zambryskibacteria bacterium]HBZ04214.1 50S ribosomal protein L18 [Candidatus Zambryskibacteria bacterium]